MQTIIVHIEKLIRRHKCVFVPQLGGFVSNYKPASIHPNSHLFLPPSLEILFNRDLNHNDGLLITSYMEEFGIGGDEALAQIEKEVKKLKEIIQEKRMAKIGRIGKLYLDERSILQFEFFADQWEEPRYYGLPAFRCLELKYLEKKKPQQRVEQEEPAKIIEMKHKEDFIQIRIERSQIYRLLSGIAIVLLFMLISTPVKTPVANYAGIFTLELPGSGLALQKKSKPTIQCPVDTPITTPPSHSTAPQEVAITSDATLKQATKTPIARPGQPEKSPAVSEKSLQTPEKEPIAESSKASSAQTNKAAVASTTGGPRYYIVVGSIPSAKDEDRLVKELRSKGIEVAGFLHRDNRIRAYIENYSDKNEAERRLATLRNENPALATAWLLSVR